MIQRRDTHLVCVPICMSHIEVIKQQYVAKSHTNNKCGRQIEKEILLKKYRNYTHFLGPLNFKQLKHFNVNHAIEF